ncbi:MAG: lipoate--protein ligase family protein [Myxococcales bacterium]|nr:lipoate--protein ligase family protein [Myxococcales bacterium]
MRWRLVCDDAASHSYGLAADDALAGRVGAGDSESTLRLYSYQPCALVGRFQTLDNELDRQACASRDMPVNRRPTGGGAIVMGPDQLGVALTVPAQGTDAYASARSLMAHFAQGLVAGLSHLGVNAGFRGKNDLEVQGKKIAGLGVYRHENDGMLFHASVLLDLDVAMMLQVLKTPFEKITDKEIATVGARTSTVRKEAGAPIEFDELRRAIARGFAHSFKVQLDPGSFTPAELEDITTLELDKYLQPEWVDQRIEVPDSFGEAKRKTPGGLLEVRVTQAGRAMKAVFIGGDFFAPEGAIADLEARLRWHSTSPRKIRATLDEVYERWDQALESLPCEVLHEVILEASELALHQGATKQMSMYGCFVDPRG